MHVKLYVPSFKTTRTTCNIFHYIKRSISVYKVLMTVEYSRSFSAFSICNNLLSQKRLVIERNRPKLGPRQ